MEVARQNGWSVEIAARSHTKRASDRIGATTMDKKERRHKAAAT
jgi:hypothetical protein